MTSPEKPPAPNPISGLLGSITELHIRIAIGALAAIVALLLMKVRFCGAITLAPAPGRPDVEVGMEEASASVRKSRAGYARSLNTDCQEYGISRVVTPEDMEQRFPYTLDENPRVLMPGKNIEVAGLRLTASARGTGEQMLMLRIENLSNQPVAYRVETSPMLREAICSGKTEERHNAVAIKANDYVIRSECIHRRGKGLNIIKVEAVTLPNELSYLYVSALTRESLALKALTADGHTRPDRVRPCIRYHEQEIEAGKTTWRDVIDYYGRHSCHVRTYRFFTNYEAFEENDERQLPILE